MRQSEVRVKPWESRRLKQLRDHAASARIVKRAVCLLLSAAGERTRDIARVTGLSRRAIEIIRRRWRQLRLRSVLDKPRPGRPSLITVEYRRELRRALRKGPLALGYVFTVWSIARLRTYLRQAHGHHLGRQPPAATGPRARLRRRPPQAHAGRQTRRAGIPPNPTTIAAAKKGAIKADATFELWYADATEFDLLPHLVRCWMPKAEQRAVRTPGKNRKLAAFGALCYGCGLFLHHTQPRVTAWGMRHLVQRLLRRARRTGRRVVLVLDRGNPNHAHAFAPRLGNGEPHVEVVWLLRYCWNLNLIERLWKHIKGSRLANVLFASYQKFVEHAESALEDFAKHPDLTLSVVTKTSQTNMRKNLVAYT